MSFIESYGHVKWKHGICKKFAMSRTHVRERACEICGWTQTRLMLDHCHRHAWIRGWLCGKCNQEIRSFENGGTGTGPTWRRMLKWNANLRVEDFITHVDKCPE